MREDRRPSELSTWASDAARRALHSTRSTSSRPHRAPWRGASELPDACRGICPARIGATQSEFGHPSVVLHGSGCGDCLPGSCSRRERAASVICALRRVVKAAPRRRQARRAARERVVRTWLRPDRAHGGHAHEAHRPRSSDRAVHLHDLASVQERGHADEVEVTRRVGADRTAIEAVITRAERGPDRDPPCSLSFVAN